MSLLAPWWRGDGRSHADILVIGTSFIPGIIVTYMHDVTVHIVTVSSMHVLPLPPAMLLPTIDN